MRRLQPLIFALVLLLLPRALVAQPALETKQRFVAAVIEFLEAVPGLYGDEGMRLSASVDAMDAGLRRWDAAVDSYQQAMDSQIAGTTPPVAAALRLPLGAVYLERGRVNEALREFDAAGELDPRRADIHLFRALGYASLQMPEASQDAVRRAWELDPEDPAKAYLYLRDVRNSSDEAKARAMQVLAAAANARNGPGTPFIQVKLLDEPSNRETIFPPARYSAAFAALATADYEEAIRLFAASLAGDPLVVDPALRSDPIRQGIAALRQGTLPAAIRLLVQGSERAPQSSEAHRILGTAYWFDEQQAKAIEHFREAIRLNPDDERSRTMLADLFSEAKQFDKAEESLRDAVRAMPESGQSHWRLGRVCQLLQRDVDARIEFERSLALAPVVGAGRLHGAIAQWYLREASLPEATRAARQKVDFDLNDAFAHKELGDALRTEGRSDEALVELLVAAWLNPMDAAPYHEIGQIYLASQTYDAAIDVLRRAVAQRPQHAESRYALALALARSGQEEEGTQQMEVARRLQAEALAESRRTYQLNLIKIDAALKSQEGRHQEAAQLWKQVTALEPQLASNHLSLGEALAGAGQHENAAAAFGEALKLSGDASIHRSLAREYAAVGRAADSDRERALYNKIKEERLRRLGSGR